MRYFFFSTPHDELLDGGTLRHDLDVTERGALWTMLGIASKASKRGYLATGGTKSIILDCKDLAKRVGVTKAFMAKLLEKLTSDEFPNESIGKLAINSQGEYYFVNWSFQDTPKTKAKKSAIENNRYGDDKTKEYNERAKLRKLNKKYPDEGKDSLGYVDCVCIECGQVFSTHKSSLKPYSLSGRDENGRYPTYCNDCAVDLATNK